MTLGTTSSPSPTHTRRPSMMTAGATKCPAQPDDLVKRRREVLRQMPPHVIDSIEQLGAAISQLSVPVPVSNKSSSKVSRRR